MKVAFIGLGIMGSRMALNLLKNGVEIIVQNRTQEAVKKLVDLGAESATTASEAVKDADVVFTMLSSPDVIEEIMLKGGGALDHMSSNTIWVDCSTVNPSFAIRSKEIAEKADIRYVDAPVAGTLPQAHNAELVFFVGGAKKDLLEIEPLLNFMGKKVIHIGLSAKGASFKMLVNMMLAQSMVIFSEAIVLGEQMGLSKSFLLDVIPNLPVTAPFTKLKVDMIKTNNYDVQFPLELMYKDLHLASVTAYENNHPLYLANITKSLFAEATKKGWGRKDFSAIHQLIADS